MSASVFEGVAVFIATLIAADRLGAGDISAAADRLAGAGCAPAEVRWIDDGSAADLDFSGDPVAARAALEGGIDIVVQPQADREKTLLVSDMDSTMIAVECIDELADYAGIKPQIAAITERAMAGELDFEEALSERVALLRGLPVETLARCHDERVRIMPGAETLVRTMRRRGAFTVLVSGGFHQFADRVAAEIGFDRALSNRLGLAGDALDGTVARPIVGAAAKRDALESAMAQRGLARARTLAIGDGANDIPMIEAAGLGLAYHAKPKVEAAADAAIRHGNLTALLWAQGIPRREWIRV